MPSCLPQIETYKDLVRSRSYQQLSSAQAMLGATMEEMEDVWRRQQGESTLDLVVEKLNSCQRALTWHKIVAVTMKLTWGARWTTRRCGDNNDGRGWHCGKWQTSNNNSKLKGYGYSFPKEKGKKDRVRVLKFLETNFWALISKCDAAQRGLGFMMDNWWIWRRTWV